MPIGKDSITKRVAKQTPQSEEKIAPELVATTAAAPAKKAATSTTKKTTTAAKKPSTTKKHAATKAEAPTVETTVLANVAPETVAAVIGHNEKEAVEIVQIGGKMPTHLL